METDFKKKLSELKPCRYSYYKKGNSQYTMKSSFLTLIDKENDLIKGCIMKLFQIIPENTKDGAQELREQIATTPSIYFKDFCRSIIKIAAGKFLMKLNNYEG